jgi:HK97 gp10 family phage protein
MARPSSFSGVNKLRRTLRRLESETRAGVIEAVVDSAEAVKQDARALVPRDEGDLARSIEVRFGRDKLTAIVGPGAAAAEAVRSKVGSAFGVRAAGLRLSAAKADALFQFFKGYWIEFGTKGGNGQPPRPAQPFMGPALDRNRAWAIGRMSEAMRRALRKASRGG